MSEEYFNTEALFNELNSVMRNGLNKILENHKLYEATHNAVMNLPSVKHELGKKRQHQQQQEEHDMMYWFKNDHSYDKIINYENNNEEEDIYHDMPDLISVSDNNDSTEINKLVKKAVEEEIQAFDKRIQDVLNSTFISLFQEIREMKDEIKRQKVLDDLRPSLNVVDVEIEIKIEKGTEEKENIVLEIVDDEEVSSEAAEEGSDAADESEAAEESDEEAAEESEAADESDEEAAEDQVAIEDEAAEESEAADESDEEAAEDQVANEDESDEEAAEDQVAIEDEEEESEAANEDEEEESEATEVETEAEKSDNDDDEYELEEVDIDGVTYCMCNENGKIYELTTDGDVGNRVGVFVDGEAIFLKK